ncbi:tetratricopeptide repeat protein [Altererythrobacter sp. MF3-039]|uniref:tetratricopeptide repeat protein n=1 Tax=Altererythrobacter sp. MF3-039 TaxID=3252901 RepID=UPI00390C89B7
MATTDHMMVYSDQSPEETKRFAIELERFDEAMRFMQGIEQDKATMPESAKLRVFYYGDTDDIGRLAGFYGVAGFFIPRAGRSVAFAPVKSARSRGSIGVREKRKDLKPEVILFHEYAHYFMYQHAAAAYPAWYREGFAEVYGTLQLKDDGFVLGAPAKHRSDILQYLSSFPVSRLLNPPEELRGRDVMQRYGMGWLLTHYLTFSKERRGQLNKYFELLNSGASDLEAAEGAFGDLTKLDRELDSYQRGRIFGLTIKHDDYTPPEASVRSLTEAEVAVLPHAIKSMRGVTKKEAKDVVESVRQVALQYPDSAPVMLALAEAEFDAENNDLAEAAALRVLELDESSTMAHIHLARIAKRRAQEDPAQFAIMREQYANAIRIDRLNPDALQGYYLSYQLAGELPPENALIALEMAYDYAPFDHDIRTTLAHLLLTEDREREAVLILSPIVNDPHAGDRGEEIGELVEKIQDGDKAEALVELAPKLVPEDEEDREDEDT